MTSNLYNATVEWVREMARSEKELFELEHLPVVVRLDMTERRRKRLAVERGKLRVKIEHIKEAVQSNLIRLGPEGHKPSGKLAEALTDLDSLRRRLKEAESKGAVNWIPKQESARPATDLPQAESDAGRGGMKHRKKESHQRLSALKRKPETGDPAAGLDSIRELAGALQDIHSDLRRQEVERLRERLNETILPALAEHAPQSPAGGFGHSPDYRWVLNRGQEHRLTSRQAHVIQILDKARLDGKPEVGQSYILEQIDAPSSRLRDIFRSRPGAWENLIKRTTRGIVALNL